jgi:hypothetical protein
MEENAVVQPSSINIQQSVIARPFLDVQKTAITPQLLAGIVYGEIVFWIMIASMVIAVIGLVIYLGSGGYFNSANLLNHLWQGCDCHTIWKEVGNVSQPLPWYSCLGMLSKGDMLAVLGLVVTGSAAVFGMWGTFLGMLRGKTSIYTIFALIIALVLTLSAMVILEVSM